jgi:hypothetical protein
MLLEMAKAAEGRWKMELLGGGLSRRHVVAGAARDGRSFVR